MLGSFLFLNKESTTKIYLSAVISIIDNFVYSLISAQHIVEERSRSENNSYIFLK